MIKGQAIKNSIQYDINIQQLNVLIVDAIQDIKGKNIVKIDLTQIDEAPADYFIICEGDSTTQVSGISDNISKRLKQELNAAPNHKEGMDNSKWVLLDYFDTIVHVFYHETRAFYELEDLWGDGKVTQYASL